MPRYILIDRNSGYIFGDTADYASGFDGALTPVTAAKLLDQSLKNPDYSYREIERHDARATYDIYRADTGGSEAIAIVQDGQDPETIAAVESECRYVATLAREDIDR